MRLIDDQNTEYKLKISWRELKALLKIAAVYDKSSKGDSDSRLLKGVDRLVQTLSEPDLSKFLTDFKLKT